MSDEDLLTLLDTAMAEPCVKEWLAGLTDNSAYKSRFKHWLLWLWAIPEWSRMLPSRLLEWQENAKGRDRFRLVDLMTKMAQEKGGTYNGMIGRVSILRSFFMHNRVEMPAALGWRPHPTKEPVEGHLTTEQVVDIIRHANLRDTAIFLTMFQGLMDEERFVQFNKKYAAALVHHLRHNSLDEPFRIDFLRGRKKNHRKFYTFIYRDALVSWQIYFERERGWPKEGHSIALTSLGTPSTKGTIYGSFKTIANSLHLVPPHEKGEQTGVAPHEAFRDVVRSFLQTAKKKGFEEVLADFWMGHSIDPYNYNKFTELELEYVMENAKIAAEYLNVFSKQTRYAGEITGEQLLQVIRDNPTLVQQLADMVKNETGKENGRMSEPAHQG